MQNSNHHFIYFIRAVIFITVSSLLACSQPKTVTTLEQVLSEKVLKVGTLYGPTTYYQDANTASGFEYELLHGFADYLGVELQVFAFYTYKELYPQLRQGHMDIAATGQAITPWLHQQFKAGPKYQTVDQQLVFLQGQTRPRSFEDINADLTVVADSSHSHILQTEHLTYPDLSWDPTNDADAEELLVSVANGELSYTLADSNVLAMLRRRYPDLSVGFTVRESLGVGWLLPKSDDDSLLGAMLDYFGQIRKNGSLNVLEEKYFGHIREFDYVETREFIKAVNDVLPQYKALFQQYAGEVDWRLLAAMSYQESHWKPDAKSPTGVRGIMMLTLATAQDLQIESRLDPEQSIMGGAKYISSLIRRIPARIPEPDRIWMALAAYNIGLGHLEDARIITQRQGASPDLWIDVKQRLPLLRQKKYYRNTKYGYARGDEAMQYVENIRQYYDTLLWLEAQNTPSPVVE